MNPPTPGPWTARGNAVYGMVRSPPFPKVHLIGTTVRMPDAVLIAAAPELLLSCETFLARLMNDEPISELDLSRMFYAVAKAKGERHV